MNGGDWVAIAGIVTGGVVSVTVPGLNFLLQHRTARLQAQREQHAQLRDVLDSAGGAVSEALAAAERRIVARGDEARRDTGEKFADKLGMVELFQNRIVIRLGDHSVARAYAKVVDELDEVGRELYLPHDDLNLDAQGRVTALLEDVKTAQLNYLKSAGTVVNRDL